MDLEAAAERALRHEMQGRALQVLPETDVQPVPGSSSAAGSASRTADAAQAWSSGERARLREVVGEGAHWYQPHGCNAVCLARLPIRLRSGVVGMAT